ncbi:MAG: hypothetical protein IJ637_00475 [Prevotella sp.]|nr:hypothetical protein [Prevotella sp.]
MKKTYMFPVTEVVVIDCDQQLLAVSSLTIDADTIIDPTDADAPGLSDNEIADMLLL